MCVDETEAWRQNGNDTKIKTASYTSKCLSDVFERSQNRYLLLVSFTVEIELIGV